MSTENKKYFAHTTAQVEDGARIGRGTKIWNNSHVMPGASIGKNCILGQNIFVGGKARVGDNVKIQNNVSVYDDVIIEDDCFVGPSAVFTNVINPRAFIERKDEFMKTVLKKGATVGANATVVCGTTLGRYSFAGAGSVVTKDMKDFWLSYGNPARHRGFVCKCGVKLNFNGERTSCKCGSKYRKVSPEVIKLIDK
ncbi:MAG: acyltransferase [Elusimicrobiota bacterium]